MPITNFELNIFSGDEERRILLHHALLLATPQNPDQSGWSDPNRFWVIDLEFHTGVGTCASTAVTTVVELYCDGEVE